MPTVGADIGIDLVNRGAQIAENLGCRMGHELRDLRIHHMAAQRRAEGDLPARHAAVQPDELVLARPGG